MKQLRNFAAVAFAVSVFALNAGPAPALTPAWGHGGGGQNLSGQWTGSITDSTLGTGTAVANLVTDGGGRFLHFGGHGRGGGGNGASLGGYFGFTFGSSTYTDPTSAGSGWDGISGVFESTIGSAACTFEYSATYSPSSYTLDGTYKATSGCSGQNGTFSLTQSCYYDEFTNGNQPRRLTTGSGPGACS